MPGRPGGAPENFAPQWSSTHQPKRKNGRKPSAIKKYIKDNNLNYYDIAALSKYILPLTKDQLATLSKDEKAPFVVRLFAVAVMKDMSRGNLSNIMQLIDRAVGKPKETHELSGPGGGPIMTREERLIRTQQLLEKRNASDDS
jgi:hypothetical protein